MNQSIIILMILIYLPLYALFRSRRSIIVRRIIERKKQGDKTEMEELAKQFIDKRCIIDSFDGRYQYVGVIKEVTNGAILIEHDDKIEAINLDFVIRMREYPVKKNGKKKAVVF